MPGGLVKKMMAAKEKLEGGSHAPNQQPKKTEIVSLIVKIVKRVCSTLLLSIYLYNVHVHVHVAVTMGWPVS